MSHRLSMLPELRLKIRVRGRHPWFYRKMVRRPGAPLAAGSAVRVLDRDGRPVGVGFYNPRTELALRMLARPEDTASAAPSAADPGAADPGFGDPAQRQLAVLLERAIDLRERVLRLPDATDAYRLLHAEGDGVPGLVLDRLGTAVVAQVFALCAQQRIEAIGEQLLRRHPDARLVLTVDPLARKREGMTPVPPPRPVEEEVVEHGVRYRVRAGAGHKTGFFADQRDNRLAVRALARGRRVLDLFCNSGGFALNAARGGAREVVAADLDEEAVAQARANAARNRLPVACRHADAFEVLRATRRGAFDLVVLDPPKWVPQRSALEGGLERYLDLNRLAFERVERGGLIVSCSCSGAVAEARFLAMLREAAAAAGRDVQILALRGAGPDHPVALECPETRYLKAAVLAVR